MKLFTVKQIQDWDQYTISNEPIPSLDLMERAAHALTNWLLEEFSSDTRFAIICGQGNNGGDGLAVCRMLNDHGRNAHAYLIFRTAEGSPDYKTNKERLSKTSLHQYDNTSSFTEQPDVIVDAIFGTGLSRGIEGELATKIKELNEFQAYRVAIDCPSGLQCDHPNTEDIKFAAHATLTLQIPKRSFFFKETQACIGNIHILDIGLSEEYYSNTNTNYELINHRYVMSKLAPRDPFDHKGVFGKIHLTAGSHGKMGAATLAAKAALRSGSGIVTLAVPATGVEIVQEILPEAMCVCGIQDHTISDFKLLEDYDTYAIGPGIGQSDHAARYLEDLLNQVDQPVVMDADALNLLAGNPSLLEHLPRNSILTPHWREFERISGQQITGPERIQTQIEFSAKHGVIVVLKGKFTCITSPDGLVSFNQSGNPGMATPGSGDALTGVISALLARGISPLDSARIGVFIHGFAGDLAREELGETGIIASDIIEQLPQAFKALEPSTMN